MKKKKSATLGAIYDIEYNGPFIEACVSAIQSIGLDKPIVCGHLKMEFFIRAVFSETSELCPPAFYPEIHTRLAQGFGVPLEWKGQVVESIELAVAQLLEQKFSIGKEMMENCLGV